MESIINEENYRKHDAETDTVTGPVGSVCGDEVVREMKTGKACRP